MPTNAITELRQIPFGVLIGQPLKAVVEAQAIAAQTTVDFIQSVGFTKPDADAEDDPIFDEQPDLGDLRLVTFKYNKVDENGVDKDATLSVPFLSILPIPMQRVDEATVEFNAKLTDMHQYSRKTNDKRGLSTSVKGGLSFGPYRMRASMRGSISQERSSASSSRYNREYTMRVYVRTVQDDIPAGLGKVFQILEDTIKERIDEPAGGKTAAASKAK